MHLKNEEYVGDMVVGDLYKKTKREMGPLKITRSLYPAEDVTDLLRMLQTRQVELKLQIKNLQDANEKALVSLEFFQKLFEYAPVGYYTLDKRGIILQSNLFGSYLLGAERSRLIGRPIHTFISPKSRSHYFGFFNRLRRGQQKNGCNVELVGEGASPRTLYMEGRPEFVGKGETIEPQLIVNAMDITVQKASENKIQELEDQYLSVLSTIDEVYFRFSRDGTFISANPSIRDLVGLTHNEQITGLSIHRFFLHAEDARFFYDELFRKGRISECETEFIKRDGTLRQILISAWVSAGHQGDIYGEGIIRDVTGIRKAEWALLETNRKIAILNEIISHDISNQLSSLRGFLSVLHNRPMDAMTAEYMGMAESAVAAITRQMEFVWIYQRTGQQSAQWQNISDVIRTLLPRNIPVKTELEPVEIFADLMLAHVFSNLFDNVERHGQYAHEIQISGSKTSGSYTIVVSDDGIGIPADEREKIFERGYGKYTGLGLFLIREILGITGITIEEISRPDEGARFEISVPKDKFRAV